MPRSQEPCTSSNHSTEQYPDLQRLRGKCQRYTILFYRLAILLLMLSRQRPDTRIEVTLMMIQMSRLSNIRTLRIAVLDVVNVGLDITLLVDDHRPEDLRTLCLMDLTEPMIRGRQARSKEDHPMDDICPSAIGAVLLLLPGHLLGPKAVIVASGTRVIQA